MLSVHSCQLFSAEGNRTRFTVCSDGRLHGLYRLLTPLLVHFMGDGHITQEMNDFKNAVES